MQNPTPQKTAPQSARKSSKPPRPKPDMVQKVVQSDNDVYLVTSQDGDQTPPNKKSKPRKKSNARKNGVQSDVGEIYENEGGQHYRSQSGKPKSTPAKAIKSDAYAGPTFHQSPAASALPMPSFFSKSVPNTATGTIAETTDGSADAKQDAVRDIEDKRETTPLDWMFDAARQAKQTPNGASPARLLSPPSRSPAPSPGVRKDEADFPFELEGLEERRSTHSTPFSQRLAASRTPQSTSEGGQALTDEERRAKTAALKQALMNSADPGQHQLGSPIKNDNPFNARNAPPSNFPPRHTSNPATPTYHNGYGGSPGNHFQQYPTSPSRHTSIQSNNRPPSSSLRNVYNPTSGAPMSPPGTAPDQRISTARSPPPKRQINFEAIYGATSTSRPQSEGNPTGHNPKPSLEQGLDDLKKALNMNFLGQA